MSTIYSLNFSPDTTTAFNFFAVIWKLTRTMKAAGWTYKASGDGHNKDTTGTASNDRWGGNADPTTDVYPVTTVTVGSNNVASSASTINVTSTSGFPTAGTFHLTRLNLDISYTNTTSTTFTGCTGGTSSVTLTNDTITFLDTYSAWWCAEGPSTVKIGISAVSSGTFQRGEIVTQSTSGATGEMLGYVINTAGNSGWMVIQPQTGTFDGTHLITGGTSGATVTATAYNLIRRQMVFAKNTIVQQGWIFYEALTDTEIAASSNTALFSDLAANAANCTASVAPGNSNSGSNRFPLYGISCIGTAEGSGFTFFGLTNSGFNRAQIVAVNPTPSAGVSADGSFWCVLNQSSDYRPMGFCRLDNAEPGDCDPYIFWSGTNEVPFLGSWGPLSGRIVGTPSGQTDVWGNAFLNTNNTMAKGYCARTTGTIGTGYDQYAGFFYGVVGQSITSTICAMGNNSGLKIRNHPDAGGTPPVPIEMFTVGTSSLGLTMRKGTMRWLGVVPLGALNDTVDSKKWLVIVASASNTPAVIVGPMDGSTTPLLV